MHGIFRVPVYTHENTKLVEAHLTCVVNVPYPVLTNCVVIRMPPDSLWRIPHEAKKDHALTDEAILHAKMMPSAQVAGNALRADRTCAEAMASSGGRR